MTSHNPSSNAPSGLIAVANPPQTPSPESALSCRGITVKYGRTVAVDEVTLNVRPHEVLGLLGPNGAGKTSLIRALTTMIPPAAGQATIAGIDLRSPDAVRNRIGVLSESSGYPGHQTAIEYLSYHGRLYGIPGQTAHHRGLHLLSVMGLASKAHSRIRTFSRGMRQRLGIARALINQPDVLFLDEPTLGLDPAGQTEILRHIRSIATNGGTTVILSSHLLTEVNRVCDRVVIMNKGRVVSSGSVAEVVQQAGVTRFVHIQVPPASVDNAVSQLSRLPEIVAVQQIASRPGELRLELSSSQEGNANLVVAALISADIPLLSFELEGATFNDAFLKLTAGNEESQL